MTGGSVQNIEYEFWGLQIGVTDVIKNGVFRSVERGVNVQSQFVQNYSNAVVIAAAISRYQCCFRLTPPHT